MMMNSSLNASPNGAVSQAPSTTATSTTGSNITAKELGELLNYFSRHSHHHHYSTTSTFRSLNSGNGTGVNNSNHHQNNQQNNNSNHNNNTANNNNNSNDNSANNAVNGLAKITNTAQIEETCIRLMARDYPNLIVIPNDNGHLSTSYPSRIVIPEIVSHANHGDSHVQQVPSSSTTTSSTSTTTTTTNGNHQRLQVKKLKDLISKARVARCRARFPIPAILYKNKYICRSATLSSAAEIYGRSVFNYTFNMNDKKKSDTDYYGDDDEDLDYEEPSNSGMLDDEDDVIDGCCLIDGTITDDDDFVKMPNTQPKNNHQNSRSTSNHFPNQINHNNKSNRSQQQQLNYSPPTPNIGDSTKMFSHFRNQDIKLLKYFSVKLICDLMLEKKKVKFGMNVTSSEKADKKNRYADFNILSLPYPGCEFFREYRDNRYCGEGLIYDWNQDFVDAEFGCIMQKNGYDEITKMLNRNFQEYRSWDVIKLTQNYIKLMLYFLKEFDSSILIHCISGWDRTPLFISLLRLSLWADGEIHKSLNAVEITYLTVAYDWLLFGHNLNDRLNKGEEIMFFCFQFLKFITGEDYSIINDDVASKMDNNNKMDFLMKDPMKTTFNQQQNEYHRKISTDSFSAYEDFIHLDHHSQKSGSHGSQTSLNRQILNCNNVNHNNKQQEDSFSLVSTSSLEIELSNQNNRNNHNHSSFESVNNVSASSSTASMIAQNVHQHNKCSNIETIPTEMIATLTLDDVDDVVDVDDPLMIDDNRTTNQSQHHAQLSYNASNGSSSQSSSTSNHNSQQFHSSTKPMEIPNQNNNIHDDGGSSLCRSDSWQLVSDASSIIDKDHHLYFSSPDSLCSLNNKRMSMMSATNNTTTMMMNNGCCCSPYDHHNHNQQHRHQTSTSTKSPSSSNTKNRRRMERLLEVRSLFNSAYTSINLNHINGGGCTLTNFVNHIYQTVNI